MEGSPPERDVLLATKLQVPRSRPGLVPRCRLPAPGPGPSRRRRRHLRTGPGGGRPAGAAAGQRHTGSVIGIRAIRAMALAAGRSNQGIASHLVISLDTVKKHISHLMGKLGAAIPMRRTQCS